MKILVLSMEAPRMPGSGGEVRSYYFIRELARQSRVSLISLGGGDGKGRVADDIRCQAHHVIETAVHGDGSNPGGSAADSKWRARMKTIAVLLFPWRRHWAGFLGYCLQYLPLAGHAGLTPGKRILVSVLQWELRFYSRWFEIPPTKVYLFQRLFDRLWPAVDELLGREKFDLLWFEHSLTFPMVEQMLTRIPEGRHPPLVCNAHNVETLLHQRIAQASPGGMAQRLAQAQSRLIRRLETSAFRACDQVYLCSEQDLAAARELAPESRYRVVGNGVDTGYFTPDPERQNSGEPLLVFTGGFGYGPNREGLHYFVREIYPLIRRQAPDVRFLFAGADAELAWQSLPDQDASIRYVSSPADIRPCFDQGMIFVVPLRVGGGTRLKVLEALAMEKPMVSTSLGAEGIPCRDGEHLLLADTPEDFAAAVLRLLGDAGLRAKLAEQGARWVREHYDWQSLCAGVPAQLEELTGHHD